MAASSGFDQPSMIVLASSRILELGARGCGRLTNRDLPVDTRAFPGTNPLEAGFRASGLRW